MFKKSLLALAVAGVTAGASAGELASSFNDSYDLADALTAIATLGTGAGTNATIAPTNDVDLCQSIATELGVEIANDGTGTGSFTYDSTATNDTATLINLDDYKYSPSVTTSVTLTGANACDVSIADELVEADDSRYSIEGAQADGVTLTASYLTGIGGVSDEDTIIFTIEGGEIDEDGSANATLTSILDTDYDGTADNGSVFTLLGVEDNTILFTVDTGEQEGREVITLTGVSITPDDDVSELTVSGVIQNTANVQYDSADEVTIVNLDNQYSSAIEVDFDGIIDVSADRLTLVAPSTDDDALYEFSDTNQADSATTDTLVVSIDTETTQGNLEPDTVEVTITGDFSWMLDLDDDEDGELSDEELEDGITFASFTDSDLTLAGADTIDADDGYAIDDDLTELTITINAGGGEDLDEYYTFELDIEDASTVLNETDYTVAITAEEDVDLDVTDESDAGEWVLNGSVVEVPYLPFGPVTQPIIRHTNTGIQTGDIAVRYMVEGDHTEWQDLGVLIEDAEPGLHNLLSYVTDALADDGYDSSESGFKVALEVTTNVPGEDVTVFAAAKFTTTDSDRLTIGAFQ